MLSMIVMKVEQSGKYTNHLKTLMFYVDASSLCLLQGKLTGFQTRGLYGKKQAESKIQRRKSKIHKKATEEHGNLSKKQEEHANRLNNWTFRWNTVENV